MRKFSAKALRMTSSSSLLFITTQKTCKFSHKGFYRVESVKGKMRLPFAPRPGQITLEEQTPETVLLRVKSFYCTAAEMDSAMQIVLQKGYQNLIVDLRGNGGGSLEGGITLAGYLAIEETYTGVYLTQRWFRENPNPPTAQQLETMPAFTQADVDAFAQELDEQGICSVEGPAWQAALSTANCSCSPIAARPAPANRSPGTSNTPAGLPS
jgi:hypothetical protein